MLCEINNFINNNLMNNNLDDLFIRLCDKYSSDESNNINSIKFVLLDRFNYKPEYQNENIKKLCEEREGQNKFRQELIIRDGKCLITGDNPEICEACHIIPYSEIKSFDIANGLLLNRCFHKMFDNYLLSINSSDCIEFSNYLLNTENFDNYIVYNGIKLNIHDECKKYLEIHWNKFIEFNKFTNIQ